MVLVGKDTVDGRDNLEYFALEVIKLAQENLLDSSLIGSSGNSVDTGALYDSLDYELEESIFEDTIELSFSMLPYGVALDAGQQGIYNRFFAKNSSLIGEAFEPAWPNGYAIQKWIQSKPVKWISKEGRFTALNRQSYVISRSIFRNGIDPTYFFSNAYLEAAVGLPEKVAIEILDKTTLRIVQQFRAAAEIINNRNN